MKTPGASLCLLVTALLCLLPRPMLAQNLLSGGPDKVVRLFNTDLLVLELKDPRKDLPCVVTPVKPVLGFDLRFHTGYEVTLPLRELAGNENLLTILFRVTPVDEPGEPVYLSQRVRVPFIEEEARGEAFLSGSFDVGEGKYQVDWLMRDRAERVCSSYWEADASLPPRDKTMALVMPRGAVAPSEAEQFREDPPVKRNEGNLLNVKVLVNFAPQNANAPTMRPVDTAALVSILRGISRDPRIGRFSLVAFNMQEQRVLYRQQNADRIDFPKLGEALETLKLGTVDLKRLSNKTGEVEFLSTLIREELRPGESADAVVFAGPKTFLEQNLEQQELLEIGQVDFPVFYMNFNLYPNALPWKDSISRAVKAFKGQEFTISRPRDLWYAMSEMVGRIVKIRDSKRASHTSTQ